MFCVMFNSIFFLSYLVVYMLLCQSLSGLLSVGCKQLPCAFSPCSRSSCTHVSELSRNVERNVEQERRSSAVGVVTVILIQRGRPVERRCRGGGRKGGGRDEGGRVVWSVVVAGKGDGTVCLVCLRGPSIVAEFVRERDKCSTRRSEVMSRGRGVGVVQWRAGDGMGGVGWLRGAR